MSKGGGCHRTVRASHYGAYLIAAVLMLSVSTAAAQSGPGLWQAAPGTGISQCTNIGSPVANRTWCADGNNNPFYRWRVWDGTQYVVVGGDSGGGGVCGFSGMVTIADSNTTALVTFATAQPNTSYIVVVGTTPISGTPLGVLAWYRNKTVNGFTVEITGPPGLGNSVGVSWQVSSATTGCGGGGGGAPVDAHYVLTLPNGSLFNAFDLSGLPVAIMVNDSVTNTIFPYGGASCPLGEVVTGISTVGSVSCVPGGAGTVTSITATLPVTVTPDPIVGTGTVACPTCVTGSGLTANQLVFGNTGTAIQVGNLTGDVTTSGTTATTLNARYKVKSCVVPLGDPGAASPFLADDNDAPVSCPNNYGADWTITSVGCWADAGSPTVTPILTGGSSTSILTGALTCGTASWAAGTVNGSPVVHSFSGGATCSSTPCSADVNITTAGGVAKYIVVKITGSLP